MHCVSTCLWNLRMNIYRTFAIIFATLMATVSIHAQDIRDCGTVTDIDGNVYQTVMMGDDCWMRENLRTLHYADGREISPVPASPNNDQQQVFRYGRLYTWFSTLNGA